MGDRNECNSQNKATATAGLGFSWRYRGRNVNMNCFASLKDIFSHLSRSSSALSGSEHLGKSLVWGHYRRCKFPSSWETYPYAVANPCCRCWDLRALPHEVAKSLACKSAGHARSNSGMAANCCWQTWATKGGLVPHRHSLDRTQRLSAHPLPWSGACPRALCTLVPQLC